MAYSDHLNPDQFSYKHTEDDEAHTISAYHPTFGNGQIPVGSLTWAKQGVKSGFMSNPPGEIFNVEVQGPSKHNPTDYRRRGVATQMYKLAQQYDPKPLHSMTQTSHGGGKEWAKAVGGKSVRDA